MAGGVGGTTSTLGTGPAPAATVTGVVSIGGALFGMMIGPGLGEGGARVPSLGGCGIERLGSPDTGSDGVG